MSAAEVRVHDDGPALADAVADALVEVLAAAQAEGRVPQIGLTGGTIAATVHEALRARADRLDWSQVVVWWGDERFVPDGDPDRNEQQAREALLDHVPVDPAKVHPMPPSDAGLSLDEAAAAYSATVREHGAHSFDVLMLGVGPDGHVASLFPGHPGLQARDAIAVGVTDSPKPPPERITLTFEALEHADRVWFLVSGEGKADAVARGLADDGSVDETPARGVRGRSETVWWLDRPAASRRPGAN